MGRIHPGRHQEPGSADGTVHNEPSIRPTGDISVRSAATSSVSTGDGRVGLPEQPTSSNAPIATIATWHDGVLIWASGRSSASVAADPQAVVSNGRTRFFVFPSIARRRGEPSPLLGLQTLPDTAAAHSNRMSGEPLWSSVLTDRRPRGSIVWYFGDFTLTSAHP
jgi:hypothetical protein